MHEQRQEHPASWWLQSQAFSAASGIPIGQHCHVATWIGSSPTRDATVGADSAPEAGGESTAALPNTTNTMTISANPAAAPARKTRAFLMEDESSAKSSSAATAVAFAATR
jgi:hypothetical protein